MASEEFEKIILFIIPKPATEAAPSIPAIAIIRVGIPFETPYPLDFRSNRQGIITAGETAAIMNPVR